MKFNNMKDWKMVSLEDMGCEFFSGFAFKSKDYAEDGIPIIKIGNIQNRIVKIDINGNYVPEEIIDNKVEKYFLNHNDVLIAMTGQGSVGRVGRLKLDNQIKPLLNQRVGKFVCDEVNLNIDFLFYVLSSKRYQSILFNAGTGSGQPNLSPKAILSTEIPYLSYDEQKRIAHVLSALDDKIEVNNKINDNLEKQAQAIFKQWFVDFEFPDKEGKPYKTNGGEFIDSELGEIPLGWKVGRLGEIVDIIDNRGKTPPLSNEKTNYPIIDVKALNGKSRFIDYNNCMKFVSQETYNSWFRNGHPEKNNILISTVGSLAEMKMFIGNIGAIAQNVVALKPKISSYYLYQYLLHIKSDLTAYDIGSVQPSIKVTHIIKHDILIPSQNQIDGFDIVIKPLASKINNNNQENRNLSELRNYLLPKLMSGEVRV